MRLASLAIMALSLAPACAGAVEFDAAIGRTGRGRCHMDNCEFYTIQAAIPVASLKDGTMFAISALSWDADYKPADTGEYDKPPTRIGKKEPGLWLAYCSKRRPHVFFSSNDGWDSVAIVAFESPSGAEEYAYDLYWASCHHALDATRELQQKLGYRFIDQPAADDAIKNPADLLKELGPR